VIQKWLVTGVRGRNKWDEQCVMAPAAMTWDRAARPKLFTANISAAAMPASAQPQRSLSRQRRLNYPSKLQSLDRWH
jgi:hypothetical protein